jgi:hypothetical protein
MSVLDLEKFLPDKAEIIDSLCEIAFRQNTSLKNRDMGKVIFLDEKKRILLEKLDEIDLKIKVILKNYGRPPESLKDKVKKINLSFNRLINIEKENDSMVSEIMAMNSGEHINAYKNNIPRQG